MDSASTASRRYVLRRNVLAYDAPDWERSGPIDDDEAGNREDSRPCRRQPFFSARMQPFHQPPKATLPPAPDSNPSASPRMQLFSVEAI